MTTHDLAAAAASSRPERAPTYAEHLGQIVWLMMQSPAHRGLALADLEWLVVPPLLLGQYKLFYDGQLPVALALWAFVDAETEARLRAGPTRLAPAAWRAGGTAAAPEGACWLVELVAPQATGANALAEAVLTDLARSALARHSFSFTVTDPATGARRHRTIDAANHTPRPDVASAEAAPSHNSWSSR